MANEGVDSLEPTVQASPLNVTALLKRENDPEPTTDQAPFGNVTALPKREADPKPMDQAPPQNVTIPPKGEAELEEFQRPPESHEIPAVTESVLLEKLGESELMIAHAAETGKDLNPEVVATITNARDAYARHAWTTDLTKQFWPAFG